MIIGATIIPLFFEMLTGLLNQFSILVHCRCANGNIEKEEDMEIDEQIETNDEISLENQKEIKENDESELQSAPNSSQVLDVKEQENGYDMSVFINSFPK